ncbi:GNAT family N-acetyltransferase [Sphingomonas soli]|uniref:GNAT family N-acetyltransferase n=1 Tax=Sphingomonas soli TaxID=266127 RepID=UPI00082A8F66|nr:GNAT family N-acetyltransferase [Sphingomonas soli]
MGLTPVPGDQLAAVSTAMEMVERPRPRPLPPSPFRLSHWVAPESEPYLALFRRVGAPWLWYSRLAMDDARLRVLLDDPKIEIYAAVDRAGIEIGMIELDFRVEGTCGLAYFGLVPELTGKGHGNWLMAHALAFAWRKQVRRVWVHTCTLDHPNALPFYRRHGFVPTKRTLETFPDPRLLGLLPMDTAPQIPVLGSVRR